MGFATSSPCCTLAVVSNERDFRCRDLSTLVAVGLLVGSSACVTTPEGSGASARAATPDECAIYARAAEALSSRTAQQPSYLLVFDRADQYDREPCPGPDEPRGCAARWKFVEGAVSLASCTGTPGLRLVAPWQLRGIDTVAGLHGGWPGAARTIRFGALSRRSADALQVYARVTRYESHGPEYESWGVELAGPTDAAPTLECFDTT